MRSGPGVFPLVAKSPFAAVLLAAGIIAAATGIILILQVEVPTHLTRTYLFIYMPAIGISGYLGRRPGGLAAAVFAAVAADFFVAAPRAGFTFDRDLLTGLAVFAGAAIATGMGAARLRDLELERGELLAGEQLARSIADTERRRLASIYDLAAKLAETLSIADVTRILLEDSIRNVGAATAAVSLVAEDGQALELVDTLGYPGDVRTVYRLVPLDTPTLSTEAVRAGKLILVSNVEELARRFPAAAPVEAKSGRAAWAAVPLRIGDRALGALTLGFATRRRFSETDRSFLTAVAQQGAQAVYRARLYEAEQRTRREAQVAQRRLAFLAQASAALATSFDYEETLQRVARLALPTLADMCVIDLVDDDGELVRVARAHVDPEKERLMRQLDVHLRERLAHSRHPVRRVLETGEPALANELTDEQWKSYVPPEQHHLAPMILARSLMNVPLKARGNVIGVLSFGSSQPGRYDDDDLALATDLAQRAALAIENARLYAREREARAQAETLVGRLAELQQVMEVPLSHLHVDALLRELLTRIRDMLDVDTASVLLLDAESNELVARAAVGLEEEVRRAIRIPVGGGFTGRIAAERRPLVIQDIERANVLSPILREQGIQSLAGAPMLVEGRVVGVLYAGTMRPHAFTNDEVRLLQLVADRVALALENARLYQRERGTAETLQRSLLPQSLPDVPGVTMAARYVPGSDAAEVGGDWYDAIQLHAGRLMLVMGDVAGKGVPAAAAMGQLRSALRAYATEGHDPRAIAHRLALMIEPAQMATFVCAVLDLEAWTLTYTAAGHPPPLVISPDGEPTFLTDAQSRPLLRPNGISSYEQASTAIAPGSTIVLYTDGLIERRDESLDDRLAQLRTAARRAAALPVEPLLDSLLETMIGAPTAANDDIAMLAVRAAPLAEHRLRLQLPATPESLSALRHALRRWLATSGASDADLYEITVAACEAATNAVEHAYGARDETFEVEATRSDDDLTIVVRDQGQWRPPRGSERGRGIMLMRSFADDVDLTAGPDGTTVTMRRQLKRGATTRSGTAPTGDKRPNT